MVVVIEKYEPKNHCDKLISLASNKWDRGSTKDKNHPARNSDIFWVNDGEVQYNVQSIYDIVAKQSSWTFDIRGIETIQIARYKKDQYYNWHIDGNGIDPISCDKNIVRKVSMSILLNDNYEGGELEIMGYGFVPNTLGTVVVFPSYFHHRVNPINKGIRYSLVAWFGGPKLR